MAKTKSRVARKGHRQSAAGKDQPTFLIGDQKCRVCSQDDVLQCGDFVIWQNPITTLNTDSCCALVGWVQIKTNEYIGTAIRQLVWHVARPVED